MGRPIIVDFDFETFGRSKFKPDSIFLLSSPFSSVAISAAPFALPVSFEWSLVPRGGSSRHTRAVVPCVTRFDRVG